MAAAAVICSLGLMPLAIPDTSVACSGMGGTVGTVSSWPQRQFVSRYLLEMKYLSRTF